MPSLMCLTEETDHTWFQGLLTFSDWILRDCRWSKKLPFHMCPTTFLHTLAIHGTDKGNSVAYIKVKMVRGFL